MPVKQNDIFDPQQANNCKISYQLSPVADVMVTLPGNRPKPSTTPADEARLNAWLDYFTFLTLLHTGRERINWSWHEAWRYSLATSANAAKLIQALTDSMPASALELHQFNAPKAPHALSPASSAPSVSVNEDLLATLGVGLAKIDLSQPASNMASVLTALTATLSRASASASWQAYVNSVGLLVGYMFRGLCIMATMRDRKPSSLAELVNLHLKSVPVGVEVGTHLH